MQVVSIPLCSFCVFIWNSLALFKVVIIFWMQLRFLVHGKPFLWFFCLFILVYFSITRLDNLVFILCLLRLQLLLKMIGLFDLRVYFIFHTTYRVGWECGRLQYLYNSCCCNIFSSSFHMKKFMPFVWLKSNCNEKGESLEELAKINFSKYSCFHSCPIVL